MVVKGKGQKPAEQLPLEEPLFGSRTGGEHVGPTFLPFSTT